MVYYTWYWSYFKSIFIPCKSSGSHNMHGKTMYGYDVHISINSNTNGGDICKNFPSFKNSRVIVCCVTLNNHIIIIIIIFFTNIAIELKMSIINIFIKKIEIDHNQALKNWWIIRSPSKPPKGRDLHTLQNIVIQVTLI